MSTTQHHDADRETLSALFDGELRGDASRFALKRLDHDADWRDACGRWQLAGDALRGQAMAAAPAGFAERVGAALASEKAAASSAVATGHARPAAQGAMPNRRRWIGGVAMAASVAAAALFVTRPLPESTAPTVRATQVATQSAAPATAGNEMIARQTPAPAPAEQASTPRTPGLPVAAESGFAAAVATTNAPDRASARPPRDPVQPVGPTPTQPGIDDPMTAAMAPTAIASNTGAVPAGIEPSSTHPFLPQGEIASRPWPRAVLPNYPTGNAFTASFDSSSAAPGSASFYPFEPRTLGAERSQDAAPPDPSGWPQR